MKVYGQLEKAQLENLASAPANAPLGYVYFDTAADQIKVKAAAGFSTLVSKGLPPVGSIVAYSGGYFSNGSNGGFVSATGNTASAINTIINADGWYVCDGSALNLAGSPIYSGANKFLPNLSDNRFLMGSTSAGLIGGQNSTTLSVNNLPTHSHTFSGTTSATSAAGSISVASATHNHSVGNLEARIGLAVASQYIYSINNDPAVSSWTSNVRNFQYNSTVSNATAITTASDIQGSVSNNALTTTVATTANLPSHTHPFSGTASATFPNDPIENRPVYLSAFYIIRII